MKQSWQHQFKRTPQAERTLNGIVFDSALEMRVYKDLLEMEARGEVKNVQRQIKHPLTLHSGRSVLTPTGRIAVYTPDLEWDDCKTGEHKIAEVKGYLDDLSSFRIRVFEAISGQTVIMIRK